MSDMDMGQSAPEAPRGGATRRSFIKGVIAAGAAVSTSAYLFRTSMTLRYKLGLTGTKLGCDRAECGACTVLVDDTPHYACSMLTHSLRGRKVQTIEGLAAPDGTLHPVQQGVVAEQGFQCAFCMPGFVMATVGFLKTNPNPTRQELAHGVSGNLCRCQDYDKILTALMHGAELSRRA
jgi:aerobic-type carbon monoxide dehydrogenase small subunit (CoxS/CutS family)